MSGDVLEVFEACLMKPFKYPRLVFKGHLYHFHKPCSRHLRWKCNRVYALKCPAVLRTSMNMLNLEYIAVDHDHNHEIDEAAITNLRMKLQMLRASSFFRNNSMFKGRNPCPKIIHLKEGISKNNTKLKPKNGYANINIDEEDIPENIKNNKLARFCASINQIFNVDPLDYDYEDNYTDGLEKIIKNKNLNDISFDFENPSIRITRNTRKQKQDAALCRSIGVGKKETTNAGRKKKVCTDLKNDITPDNFKTLKSYQQSLNSEDGNLTECETDINTTKSKEIKTNLSSTQVMVDLIKDIPPSTTASILIPESSESKKRSVSECDTYITRSKTKIIKTNHSSIPNFDNLNVHIPPETTISIISPESIYTEQDNLTQSDSGIEITKSKVIETNEQSTLESSNICPDFAILTQYGTEIEFSEITESNMIDCYEPATSASIDRTVNNPPVITTSGLSSYLFSNQKTISTQYNTDIRKTRSKTMESSPAYIDLTVDSPPDMISSSVNPNMLNGQSSSTLHNTQIECYEPSTSTSIDLTVNDLPIMMNSMLKNKTNIFTQCNKDIEITSLTSMSTDLRSNNPTFSSSSVKATTPLNSNDDLCMDGESKVKKRTTFDVFVVGKDAQLSTVDAKRIKRIDWKCPQALFVSSNQIPVELSHQNAILPVALKRINENPPSQYPLLNMLLTKPNNTVIKPAEINTTPFNNQMNTPFPPKNTIIKQDKRTFILNIPVNSVNNRMKAPLPDVVYESTQITNKINYQETIHSNYSYNLRKAAHKMKPVPIAIPLPPSEIIYGYSDEI